MLETTINGDVLLELTRETVKVLESKQEELSLIRWTDGEANTDMGFSTLAAQCCTVAWQTVRECHSFLDINIQASAD